MLIFLNHDFLFVTGQNYKYVLQPVVCVVHTRCIVIRQRDYTVSPHNLSVCVCMCNCAVNDKDISLRFFLLVTTHAGVPYTVIL
jgi:hypothetical protein